MFIRGEVKGSVRDSVMEYNKEDDVIVTDFKDKCLTERWSYSMYLHYVLQSSEVDIKKVYLGVTDRIIDLVLFTI